MAISPERFRKVLSKFATGVSIVTLRNDEGIHGLTVNAFASVSLEPPLVLICIQKNGASRTALSQSKNFVVNILREDQRELADRFSSPKLSGEDRFHEVAHHFSRSGLPILDGILTHIECRIVNEIDAGDHTIFLGEVAEAEISDDSAQPLLFYNSQYYANRRGR